jgi:multiple sugar transport system substrate-binding protein
LTKDRRHAALLDGSGIDGVQFAADLANRWRVTPTPEARATGPQTGVNVSFFESGRLAFFPSGHFHYIVIKQRVPFTWGVAPLPQGTAGARTWMNAWHTGISAGTGNQDAAWAFLEFCLRPENYVEFLRFVSWMPPIKLPDRPPLIEDPQHWSVMSNWVAQSGRPLPAIPQIDDILSLANTAMKPVLETGEQTARAAAQDVSPQIDAVLARA